MVAISTKAKPLVVFRSGWRGMLISFTSPKGAINFFMCFSFISKTKFRIITLARFVFFIFLGASSFFSTFYSLMTGSYFFNGGSGFYSILVCFLPELITEGTSFGGNYWCSSFTRCYFWIFLPISTTNFSIIVLYNWSIEI